MEGKIGIFLMANFVSFSKLQSLASYETIAMAISHYNDNDVYILREFE